MAGARGWRGGVLVLSLALAPAPALAQAGSKAPPPPPAPTVFARKPEPRRTLALSSRAEWIAPVVRRLAVRPMARSAAPARRLAAVNLKGSARPARPTSPPALAAAPVTAAKVDQGAAPAAVSARAASSTPNAARAAAPNASTAAVTPPRAAPATASSTNTSAPARPAASAVPRATASAPPRTVAASTPTSSAAQERAGWANITYISGPSVYLDAGTRAGLKEGSRLEVFRGNRVIAELLVAYVSSTRSSCSVTTSTLPIEVGDSAPEDDVHGPHRRGGEDEEDAPRLAADLHTGERDHAERGQRQRDRVAGAPCERGRDGDGADELDHHALAQRQPVECEVEEQVHHGGRDAEERRTAQLGPRPAAAHLTPRYGDQEERRRQHTEPGNRGRPHLLEQVDGHHGARVLRDAGDREQCLG